MSTTKKGRTRRLNSSSSVCDDMVTQKKRQHLACSISPHDGVTANARRIKDSFFFEQSMLNCDSKMKDSRLTMKPQSASRIWTCFYASSWWRTLLMYCHREWYVKRWAALTNGRQESKILSPKKGKSPQNFDPKTMHVPVVAATRHQATPAKAGRYSEWSQPCMQGFIEDSPPIESAGGDSTQGKQPEAVPLASTPNESKPTRRHHVFTPLSSRSELRIVQHDQRHAFQISEPA